MLLPQSQIAGRRHQRSQLPQGQLSSRQFSSRPKQSRTERRRSESMQTATSLIVPCCLYKSLRFSHTSWRHRIASTA